MNAGARIEVRVSPEIKARLERAAELDHHRSLSSFMLDAAQARAEDVLRQHETHTTVPARFFDDLIAALDAPAVANEALTRAARRSHARGTRF